MPTKPRNIIPDEFYHIYNRAVDKRTIFYTDQDYRYFIERASFFKDKVNIKMLAYCILPNHWHFLLKESKEPINPTGNPLGREPQISKFISLLSNSYTKYFNLNKDHSGRIFQGPFKSKMVNEDNYLRVLINYINLNPLKHKIVKNINDWDYTSHHNYIGEGKCKLINKDYLIDFLEYKKGVNSYINVLRNIEEEF